MITLFIYFLFKEGGRAIVTLLCPLSWVHSLIEGLISNVKMRADKSVIELKLLWRHITLFN